MNTWQDIGHDLEAKVAECGSIWVRTKGQVSEYPHSIVDVDNHGNIIGFHLPDTRCVGSIEGNYFTINLVKEKLGQLQKGV